MKLQQIEILVQKYYVGESSIEEEKQLKEFFSENEVPEHLQAIQDQLAFFTNAVDEVPEITGLEERIKASLEQQQKAERNLPRMIGRILTAIAATVLLIFAIQSVQESFNNIESDSMGTVVPLETCTDEVKCQEETEMVLKDVSKALNEIDESAKKEID